MKLVLIIKSLFVCLLFVTQAHSQSAVSAAIPADLKNFQWQTGDIIGVSELFFDWSTFFFEAATGSRYGHVGIVSVEPSGIYVFEENDPYAQKTALNVFLSRAGKDPKTHKTLASILRLKVPLSIIEVQKILWAANAAVVKKIPYNYSQMMNSQSLNCSEFVHAVFAYAGRNVGKIEKLSAMNLKAFDGWLLKAWELKAGKVNLQNLVISPMSVILSDSLYPAYANLPTDYYLSDRQIYAMWKNEGFTTELSNQTYVPEFILDTIGARAATQPWRRQPAPRRLLLAM